MAARFFADPKSRGRKCAECKPDLRRRRNCDGQSNPGFREGYSGLAVKRCPLAEISQYSRHMLGHYGRYRDHGVLPRGGGAEEQDARTLQALDVLAQEAAMLGGPAEESRAAGPAWRSNASSQRKAF